MALKANNLTVDRFTEFVKHIANLPLELRAARFSAGQSVFRRFPPERVAVGFEPMAVTKRTIGFTDRF